MDLNGLNWCFFPITSSPNQICGIFLSRCASARFVGSVCGVGEGAGKMWVDLVMWGIVINFVIVIKNT